MHKLTLPLWNTPLRIEIIFLILSKRLVIKNPYMNWNEIITVETVEKRNLVARPGYHIALKKLGKAPHVRSTEMLGNCFHLSRNLYFQKKMTVISFTECLCQEIKLSSHVVSVVIGTRVRSVARLPLITVTSRLEQWKVVDTSAIVKWRT